MPQINENSVVGCLSLSRVRVSMVNEGLASEIQYRLPENVGHHQWLLPPYHTDAVLPAGIFFF